MISFVIPAYNESSNIGLCIIAIHEEAIKHGEYEIIVVDNCSNDDTVKKAKLFKKWGVRIVSEPHKGVTRARQAGYKVAVGDIICNIDADTYLPKGWLRHALQALNGAVMATGPVVYLDFPPSLRFLARIFYRIGHIAHYVIGPIAMGGNTIMRAYALDMIGGYNSSIDFWGEDTDTAKRMSKIGKVRYDKDMWVYASSRRFDEEGIITTTAKYVVNYLSVSLWVDLSIDNIKTFVYEPQVGSPEKYNIVTYEVDGVSNWYWRDGDWGGFMYPAQEWYKIRDTVLKCTPGRDVIVQAGGCCGMYPRLWSKYFTIVHTFEPVDENFEALCKNCPDHIIKHRCALGDSNEPIMMQGGAEIVSQEKLVKNVGMYWVTQEKTGKNIYQLMLDQLQLPKLDAMQLDVEQYEIHVLRGAIETIKRCSPTICVETYDDDVKDFLSNLGYRVVERAGEESWLYPGDTVLVRQ